MNHKNDHNMVSGSELT